MNRNFYHIYPLGLTGATERNDLYSEPISRINVIYDWVDHLRACGFNAIYFGPLFESESHGYDTVDYYRIDRRLGTNEEFANLCLHLKEKGFAIFVDGVFNHVSRQFGPFLDLVEKEEQSQFKDWFKDVSFNPLSCSYWEGHDSLVELNLSNSHVRDHLLGAVGQWYREFHIDGIRLDVAYCLDKDFLRELRTFTRSLKGDFELLGEIIHGDYREWLDTDLLDSVTNYECYKGIHSSLNDNNYYEIAHSLNRLFGENGIYRSHRLYNFIDNHDVNRIASTLTNPVQIYNALILLYCMPGNPSIYYGSEWQIEGVKEDQSDKNLRPEMRVEDHPANEGERDFETALKKIANIRWGSPALQFGDYCEIHKNSNQLIFLRRHEEHMTICALNSSDREVSLQIPAPRDGEFRDLLNESDIEVREGVMELHLWPMWGAVIESMG